MTTTSTTKTYAEVTKEAKLAARDILRAEKVSALLSFKKNLKVTFEADKKNIEEIMATVEKKQAVKEFEANAIDAAHPLKEEKMKEVAEMRKLVDEQNNERANHIKELEKNFAEKTKEYNDKIEAWNTGKSLVSADALKTLTEKLVTRHFEEVFISGVYAKQVEAETKKDAEEEAKALEALPTDTTTA